MRIRATSISRGSGTCGKRKGLIALLLSSPPVESRRRRLPPLTKELFDMLENILTGKGDYPDPEGALKKRRYSSPPSARRFCGGLFPGRPWRPHIVFDYIVRKRYFAQLTEKDYRFFAAFSSGDLVTRLMESTISQARLVPLLGDIQGCGVREQGDFLRRCDVRPGLAPRPFLGRLAALHALHLLAHPRQDLRQGQEERGGDFPYQRTARDELFRGEDHQSLRERGEV